MIAQFNHLPRLLGALALTATLLACGTQDNNGVRNGPQAIHPSPSALAQGTSMAVCGTEGRPDCT